jgi:hypothetical protein
MPRVIFFMTVPSGATSSTQSQARRVSRFWPLPFASMT